MKNTKIIWGVVIAVIVIIAGVFAYNDLTQTYSEPVKSDWKTYTNEKYGFSFQYPAETFTQIPEKKEQNEVVNLDSNSGSLIVSVVSGQFDPNKQYGNLEKIAKVENGINGNAYFYSHATADCGSNIMGTALGNQTMWVSFLSCKDDSAPQLLKNGELQKQILSTFKFTTPVVKTETPKPVQAAPAITWKTYVNSLFGYSIKYPSTWKIDQSTGSLDTTVTIDNPNHKSTDTDDLIEYIAIDKSVKTCEGFDWKNSGWTHIKRVCLPNGFFIYMSARDEKGKATEDSMISTFVLPSTAATTTRPSITVTSPNGGEIYAKGTSVSVQWSQMNQNDYVRLFLVPGDIAITSTANAAANFKSPFNWNIPFNTAPGSYKVEARIYDVSGNVPKQTSSDLSDNYFTITN